MTLLIGSSKLEPACSPTTGMEMKFQSVLVKMTPRCYTPTTLQTGLSPHGLAQGATAALFTTVMEIALRRQQERALTPTSMTLRRNCRWFCKNQALMGRSHMRAESA